MSKPAVALYAGAYTPVEGVRLLKEYLDLAQQYPTPMRMVRGHTFGLIGEQLIKLVVLLSVLPARHQH